jgi:transposase InsO family protein
MNADIEQAVNNCLSCAEYQKQQNREPLMPTPTPDLPHSYVGTDVFEFRGKKYLILVDHYSKYIDAIELRSETTTVIIEAMKTVFACHGLPGILRSDNGPQFSSANFKNGIEHERSSFHFQSSNGEAERAVQTIKSLWIKCDDKQLALLDYRTTPLENINLSPAQLLMGRRVRNTLPASQDIFKPATYDLRKVKQHLNAQKAKQKFYYDRRKNVKELAPLNNGTSVRMETSGSKSLSPGVVVEKTDKLRSYLVKSNGRLYRRNRVHLHKSSETPQDEHDEQDISMEDSGPIENTATPEPAKTALQTRSGRIVKPPEKLDL